MKVIDAAASLLSCSHPFRISIMQKSSLSCTTRRLLNCKRCYSSVPLPLLHPPSTPPRPGYVPSTQRFGQPLPSTHPHLLSQGELTPGIQAKEYEQR